MTRTAKSLLEVLVAVAIVGTLVGLLLPAIQRVRHRAGVTECANQVRQIGIAAQNYAADHGGDLPPVDAKWNPYLPNPGPCPPFFFTALLPYLEAATGTADYLSGAEVFYLKIYVCPLDPDGTKYRGVGGHTGVIFGSYAANGQAFTGRPNLARTFADGTANTIALAEHKLTCRDYYYEWGGSEPSTFGRPPTFAHRINDLGPVTRGSPPVSLGADPDLTFQVAPTTETCIYYLAHTTHRDGMGVGMVDGSYRTLPAGMPAHAYWALVTPAAGDIAE
ncbi:MAG: DUF1559 domain-containing protein [Gemmataceae bacterium]|nr:DUF1559 domain-containing protein [Gemmataceae bacterium]